MQSVNPKEKQININGLNINYKQIGNGDVPIVLLHGWGVNSGRYIELAKEIFNIQNSKFKIQIPDLPGFGKSEEPKEDWGLDDYVEFVDKFIEKANRKSGFELVKNLLKKFDPKKIISIESQKISDQEIKINDKQSENYDNMNYHSIDVDQKKILKQVQDDKKIKDGKAMVLIGHSFGGRVAIKYAAKYPEKIDKLILTGAAGIKHKLTFKQGMFYILAKIGKKIFSIFLKTKLPIRNLVSFSRKFLYKLAGEKDYCKASPRMKEVMKNVLAEDLTPVLSKIKVPALLAWGKNDKSAPLADGKLMKERIKNSELVIVENANHSLPYQKPEEFAKIVAKFIEER